MTDRHNSRPAQPAPRSVPVAGLPHEELHEVRPRSWGARISAVVSHPFWLVVLATLVVFFNVLADPSTLMIGHQFSEAMDHTWIQWLVNHGYVRHLASPFHHPEVLVGADVWLFPTDFTTRLAMMPFHALIGETFTYNLGCFLLVLFAGYGTYLLAREVGVRPWESVFGALFVCLHPSFLGFLADGRQDALTLGWAAITIRMWLRLMREPDRRRAMWLAASAAVLVSSSPNYTYVVAMMLAIPTLIVLARGGRRHLCWTPASVVLAIALAAPSMATLYLTERASGGRAVADFDRSARALYTWLEKEQTDPGTRDAIDRWAQTQRLDRGPAVMPMLEAPSEFVSKLSKPAGPPAMTLQAFSPGSRRFLGIVETLLWISALVLAFRRSAPWMAGVVIATFLAFGDGLVHAPPISIPGISDMLILRPSVLLNMVPIAGHFANYGTFAVVATLFGAVTATIGLQALTYRVPRRAAATLTALCVAGWCLEVQLLGPVPAPVRAVDVTIPDIVRRIGQEPGRGGVFVVRRTADIDRYLQLFHHRPITSPWFRATVPDATAPIAGEFLRSLLNGICDRQPPEYWPQRLSRAGIDWLLLPLGLVHPDEREQLLECVTRAVGSPVSREGLLLAYRVAR